MDVTRARPSEMARQPHRKIINADHFLILAERLEEGVAEVTRC